MIPNGQPQVSQVDKHGVNQESLNEPVVLQGIEIGLEGRREIETNSNKDQKKEYQRCSFEAPVFFTGPEQGKEQRREIAESQGQSENIVKGVWGWEQGETQVR